MSEERPESLLQFSGIGGIAVIGGIVCCIGLKLVGGAVLFGGLAAAIGLTTDQTTFLLGGVGGLVLGGLVLSYRKFGTVAVR